MALGNLLKGRLRQRRGSKGQLREIPADLPTKDKISRIHRLVTESLLPREILLTGTETSISLTAANSRICAIQVRPNAGEGFSFDFTSLVPDADIQTATLTFLEKLRNMLNSGDLVDINLSGIIDDFENDAGIAADFLMREPENLSGTGLSSTTPATSKNTARDALETGISESAPNDMPIPFEFATKARPYYTEAVYFSEAGEQAFVERKKIDRYVDRSEFSALAEWHKHMSPTLGNEMMFVFLDNSASTTAYAVSLNENDGVAVMFNRPKMGQICLSWFKSRFVHE